MSGIFGLFHPDGRAVDASLLDAMAATLAHRGPDGLHVWREGAVGLGCAHRITTPEARHERLPLSSRSGVHVLTADLRLDNRPELLDALDLDRRADPALPDATLLLAAWERWGPACLPRLLGDFAFVLWDGREGRLHGARDAMGIKPLYHAWSGAHGFAFASEVKALRTLPWVGDALDPSGVALHLLVPVVDDPACTIFRDVRALPWGHRLEVDGRGVRTEAWWQPDPTRVHAPASDAEVEEEFRAVFLDAVRVRLRTDAPVAAMLSGGLDSSSIVSAAGWIRREAGVSDPLVTLSGVYDDVDASDEQPYLRAVLEAWPARSELLHADRLSPLADHDEVVALLDRPNPAPNLHLSWGLFPRAQAHGARVLLDGYDGDTVVSHGLGAFAEYARRGRLVRLRRELSAWGTRNGRPWKPTLRELLRYQTLGPRLDATGLPTLLRRLRGRGPVAPIPFGRDPDWAPFLTPSFANELDPLRAPPKRPVTSERDHHHRLLTRPLLFRTVELLDPLAARFGLDLRLPYMDRRMVELCLSLPPEQKVRDGWTRSITRRALHGILPPAVETRVGKSDLGPGFFHAFKRFEFERLQTLVADDPGGVSRWVRTDWTTRARDAFLQGTSGELEVVRLWRTLTLGLWLERR